MALAITRMEISDALISNYNDYARGVDNKDWTLVRSCFAQQVYIDYGSISAATGDPDTPRNSDDWVRLLQAAINGFDVTRHFLSNHRVEISGELVSCSAYMHADHVIFTTPGSLLVGENELVRVVGEYTNCYEKCDAGWKICRSRLEVFWSSGNFNLFQQAAARAARAARHD